MSKELEEHVEELDILNKEFDKMIKSEENQYIENIKRVFGVFGINEEKLDSIILALEIVIAQRQTSIGKAVKFYKARNSIETLKCLVYRHKDEEVNEKD